MEGRKVRVEVLSQFQRLFELAEYWAGENGKEFEFSIVSIVWTDHCASLWAQTIKDIDDLVQFDNLAPASFETTLCAGLRANNKVGRKTIVLKQEIEQIRQLVSLAICLLEESDGG